jgi:hypothetical protein
MWQLFLTEFPEDKFECSTTLRRMMYPDEQGLNLPTAIREGRPFVISFSPKMVQGESVTVQFRELAGNGAIIDYLSAAVTTPDGKEYHQDGDSVISITVPPYGRASYTWTGSYWMKGASVNLRFDDSHSSMDTLWVATQLNSN